MPNSGEFAHENRTVTAIAYPILGYRRSPNSNRSASYIRPATIDNATAKSSESRTPGGAAHSVDQCTHHTVYGHRRGRTKPDSASSAGWQSGYAEDCKSLETGSIPVPASILTKFFNGLKVEYSSFITSGSQLAIILLLNFPFLFPLRRPRHQSIALPHFRSLPPNFLRN